MHKQIFIKQRTPEWFEWRKGKIGSSDVAAIIGEHYKESPLMKYEQIKYGVQKEVTVPMQKGIMFEDLGRQEACRLLGVKYEEACFEDTTKPYLICSADGWCENTGLLEVKIPSSKKNLDLAEAGIIPIEYRPQGQYAMYRTNTKEMFFNIYDVDRDKSHIILMKRDDFLCEHIERCCDIFYKMLQDGVEPEATELDYLRFDDVDGLEAMIVEADTQEKIWSAKKKELREAVIKKVGERNAYLGNLRITKTFTRGRIDYDSIPALNGVDCESYRKKGSYSFLLTLPKIK